MMKKEMRKTMTERVVYGDYPERTVIGWKPSVRAVYEDHSRVVRERIIHKRHRIAYVTGFSSETKGGTVHLHPWTIYRLMVLFYLIKVIQEKNNGRF